jgi:RsiW-degrading membrane proteinase PrsW (M82 family)
METKFRPGSMGAAEEKDRKKVLIGAAVIYIFILLCFFVFPFYTKDIAKRAGAVPNIIGVLLVIASYAGLYFNHKLETKSSSGAWVTVLLIAGGLVLGMLFMGGFNFDLRGLQER